MSGEIARRSDVEDVKTMDMKKPSALQISIGKGSDTRTRIDDKTKTHGGIRIYTMILIEKAIRTETDR